MSGSVNKVILVGNLARDPEIRTIGSNGDKVANMRLITSESWTDKTTNQRRELAEGHNITVFNEALIRVIENYCKKGDKLYIEGALQTRKWQDKDGNDQYTTEVILKKYRGELTMLGSKSDRDAGYDGEAQNDRRPTANQTHDEISGKAREADSGRNRAPAFDPDDEDVPF